MDRLSVLPQEGLRLSRTEMIAIGNFKNGGNSIWPMDLANGRLTEKNFEFVSARGFLNVNVKLY